MKTWKQRTFSPSAIIGIAAIIAVLCAFAACDDGSGGTTDPKVTSISAVYNQGGATVYTTTPLDDLRIGLTVTAHYSDGTSQTATDYTLKGTLAVGSSTVTVTYQGHTTTFTVSVSGGIAPTVTGISAVYVQNGATVYTTTPLDNLKTGLTVTAHYSNGTSQTVTAYTLNGTLTVGSSTVTVTYQGHNTDFTVTVSVSPRINERGFNDADPDDLYWYDENGIRTDKLWDTTGYKKDNTYYRDDEGYDYIGRDINGFPKATAVGMDTLIPPGSTFNDYLSQPEDIQQIVTHTLMGISKTNLTNQATAIHTLFNGSTSDKSSPVQYIDNVRNAALLTQLQNSYNEINNYIAESTRGDMMVGGGLRAISMYIVAIERQLGQGQFMDLMDAYRTKVYNAHRGHGDKSGSWEELTTLCDNLGLSPNNEDDIRTALLGSIMGTTNSPTAIAQTVNPAVIESLLNQIKSMEQFYANVDDIVALDLDPVTNNQVYGTHYLEPRSIEYTHDFIRTEQQTQSQQQGQSLNLGMSR